MSEPGEGVALYEALCALHDRRMDARDADRAVKAAIKGLERAREAADEAHAKVAEVAGAWPRTGEGWPMAITLSNGKIVAVMLDTNDGTHQFRTFTICKRRHRPTTPAEREFLRDVMR